MRKTHLAIVALLLAPVSSLKLVQERIDIQDTQCLAQNEFPKFSPEPEEASVSVAVRGLEELGRAIRYENKGVEHAACEASEQVEMLAKQLGVKLDEDDTLSPGSIADKISAEYGEFVKQIPQATDQEVNDARSNLDEVEDETKARYEVDAVAVKYLISAEEEEEGFRPAKFFHHYNGTQWQIKELIPSSNDILQGWTRFIRNLDDDAKYQYLLLNIQGDLEAFNQILLHEGKRLDIKLPMSLPDPSDIANKMKEIDSRLANLEQRRKAITFIHYVDQDISEQVATSLALETKEGQQTDTEVEEDPSITMSLFRNHLLAEVGKATLNIVEEANRSGDFDRLYQQLQELDKKAGIFKLDTFTTRDFKNLLKDRVKPDDTVNVGSPHVEEEKAKEQLVQAAAKYNKVEEFMGPIFAILFLGFGVHLTVPKAKVSKDSSTCLDEV